MNLPYMYLGKEAENDFAETSNLEEHELYLVKFSGYTVLSGKMNSELSVEEFVKSCITKNDLYDMFLTDDLKITIEKPITNTTDLPVGWNAQCVPFGNINKDDEKMIGSFDSFDSFVL